jgi:peptide/nickel transport system ATP-binding protein
MLEITSTPVLEVRDLTVSYMTNGSEQFNAVAGVSLTIPRGSTLGLVGESGCGKSTTARAVMQLTKWSGEIRLEGTDLSSLSIAKLRSLRPRFQMIFQDPISSLNPRRRIREIMLSQLRVSRLYTNAEDAEKRVMRALEQVGMDPSTTLGKFPHEFSGGQCQRLCIARAIILNPILLVCDEAVSALDVSVRAQILNVLNGLKAANALSQLFISHDLAVIKNVSDYVAVMYLGKICESGPAADVLAFPKHPYTRALLSSVLEPEVSDIEHKIPRFMGEVPSALNPPSGCRYRTRCVKAQPRCAQSLPESKSFGAGHEVACFFPD